MRNVHDNDRPSLPFPLRRPHLYQGTGAVFTIAGQSVLTGYLAYRLKNLRLVIVAHCTLDLLAGLVGSL